MAIIIDLPPEILEQIYHYLGSIDDVHHFGRMCSKTHHVIQKQNIYLEIMRSIIHSSPQHRYDFQLCRSLDLHRKIVAHLERHPMPFAASQPGVFSFSIWETQLMQTARSCSSPAEWTDDMICDILARYQGLRVLENIWLERELQEQDFLSVDDTSDAQRFVHRFATLVDREQKFRDGDLPRRNPNTPHTWYYTELNADQRERFYAAVTCVWLLNEIRWVLTNFAYPANFTVQIEILGALKARIEWRLGHHYWTNWIDTPCSRSCTIIYFPSTLYLWQMQAPQNYPSHSRPTFPRTRLIAPGTYTLPTHFPCVNTGSYRC
jgi:hypothetical protein